MRQFLHDIPVRFRRVTAHGSYVSQIDGMRFLALAPVLLWHAGLRGLRSVNGGADAQGRAFLDLMPNGRVGVELFFFISGYIIAYPFLVGRRPALGQFFRRRLLRIEPPYLLVMCFCFLSLSMTGYKPQHTATFSRLDAPLWQSFVASLGYLHVILFQWEPYINPPAWSLEVEVEFYILSPFLLYALTRIGSPRQRRALTAVLMGAMLLLSACFLGDHMSVHQLTLIGHGWSFLLGILLCDWSIEHRPFEAPPTRVFDVLLVLGYMVLIGLGLFENRDFSFTFVLVRDGIKAIAITAIFLGAARGVLGRRALGNGWVALLGGACYSIYLTHVPVMQAGAEVLYKFVHPPTPFAGWLLGLVVLIPFAILMGLLFYIAIERPCMEPDWPLRLVRRLGFARRQRSVTSYPS